MIFRAAMPFFRKLNQNENNDDVKKNLTSEIRNKNENNQESKK
jgi:hypothetical protein